LIHLLVIVMLLAAGLSMVRPAAAQVGPTATVNTGALNVRSGPGSGYGVLTSMYRGTTMTMIARNDAATWVKVITPTAVQGWVSVPFIVTAYSIYSLPVEGGSSGGATASVNTGALNVRYGPGVGYGVMTSLPFGAWVTMLARNADASWVKIAVSGGAQGWVNSRYLATSYPIISLPIDGGTVPPPPPPPTYRTHVVQPGENLFRIALRYGVNMYDVARLNGIYDLRLIYVGQTLLIP
jgi:uncharacterized protein YraI